ncbi:MAG: HEAT repeat domain-containing protein [Candidatus Wallbacteria bacterium]|nr:HEAT repeat domain-containing protein [Candidatus Wallbacteria bacterium]
MIEYGRGLAAILKDLESPLEDARLAALQELGRYPSLAALRGIRQIAAGDTSPTLRMEARRLLAAYSERLFRDLPGAPDAQAVTFERLESMLADPEPGVRAKLARHLATLLEPRVPAMLEGLLARETDPFVVCSLLQSLAAAWGLRAQARLEQYLSHPDPRVRATAIEALVATGTPDLPQELIPLLQDPHDRVRVAAARALHAQERESVLASLDEMLASRQDLTLRSALYLLRYWEDEVSLPRLREALRAAVGEARRMALGSLQFRAGQGSAAARELFDDCGETPPPAGVFAGDAAEVLFPVESPLEERLASPSAETRVAAIREVVRLGRADLLPRLLDSLTSPQHPGVLATLVSAAGRLGAAADAPALVPFLSADEPRLRANAIEAIGLLDARTHAAALSPALSDSHNRVRANAVLALAGVAGQDVMPTLRAMAESPQLRMRVSAVYVAAVLATPASVSVLTTLHGGDDAEVRRRARAALETLAPVMSEAACALATVERSAAAAPVEVSEETLQRLLFNLEHDSAQVRLGTLRELASIPDRRLLAGLGPLLRDADSMVRQAALETARGLLRQLAPMSEPAAKALSALEDSLAGEVEDAQGALAGTLELAAQTGARPVAQTLSRLLPAETRPAVRASMLSALALVGDAESVLLFRACLRDPDPRVRANAVSAIELAGGEADQAAAVVCLADPDPRVRAAAIRVSMRVSKEEFLSHLRAMISAPAVAERAAALHVLRTMRFGKRLELLKSFFVGETDPRLYEAAARALAVEQGPEHRKELERLLLRLEDGAKRQCLSEILGLSSEHPAALTALPTPGQPSVTELRQLQEEGLLTAEAVRKALATSKDSLTIVTLLKAAAELRMPDALALTQPFTYSRDRRVRLAATGVLGRLDDPPARACLRELVKDRDPEVSLRAVHSLRMRAPESAFQAVCSLLELNQTWAVKRGLELLEKIGDPAALPFVLLLLERGTHPSYVEPAAAIVLAAGRNEETLRLLAGIYRRVPPNSRVFVQELAFTLGRSLGQPQVALAGLFPPAPGEPEVQSEPLPAGPPPGHVRFSYSTLAAAGILYAFAILALIAWLLPESEPAGRPPSPAVPPVAAPAVLPGLSPVSRPATRPPDATIAFPEAERLIARDFERLGVKSPHLLRALALDRADRAWQSDIERAEAAMTHKDHDTAVSVLTTTLATLDPDHLAARIEVLRVLELATRLAGYPGQARQWASWQASSQKRFLDLVTEAARQGGVPAPKVQAALSRYAERRSLRESGLAFSELFGGGY